MSVARKSAMGTEFELAAYILLPVLPVVFIFAAVYFLYLVPKQNKKQSQENKTRLQNLSKDAQEGINTENAHAAASASKAQWNL